MLIAYFGDARFRQGLARGRIQIEGQQRDAVQPRFRVQILRQIFLLPAQGKDVFAQQGLHEEEDPQALTGRILLHGTQPHEAVQGVLDLLRRHMFAGDHVVDEAGGFLGHIPHRVGERIVLGAQKASRLKGIGRIDRIDPPLDDDSALLTENFLYVHGSTLAKG